MCVEFYRKQGKTYSLMVVVDISRWNHQEYIFSNLFTVCNLHYLHLKGSRLKFKGILFMAIKYQAMVRMRNVAGEEELSIRGGGGGGGERSGLLFNKTRPPHWLLSLSPRPSRPGLLNNVKAIYLLNSLTLTECLKCTNFNPTMKALDRTIFWPLASVLIEKKTSTHGGLTRITV